MTDSLPTTLPIHTLLSSIDAQLDTADTLVIQAPPGAGKTTALPLHWLRSERYQGQIVLIQPRRLAVYSAARFLASELGESPGGQVGYRTRHDQQQSANTRLLIVTAGIYLRMVQQDPALTGIDLVVFDEFHERAGQLDLALAFTRDAQQGYRDASDPLQIVVMSATLDGQALSEWLAAPLLSCEGRCYPVDTHYCPVSRQQRWSDAVADCVLQAMSRHPGSALVFLPGWREIHQVNDALLLRLPVDTDVHCLHGSLPAEAQQAAIQPALYPRRKIVLTTNIAETSLTIEGVQIVVDSGLVRRQRYQERRGMDSLETERISQASAEQRRGRAGRTAPGVCYRLWSAEDQQRLNAFDEPEIVRCDLVPIALEIALWGCQSPAELTLLDTPDVAAFGRANQLLQQLGLLDAQGRPTPSAQPVARLGLTPRLGRLIYQQRGTELVHSAIATAALLSEGDPLRFAAGQQQADVGLRLHALSQNHGAPSNNSQTRSQTLKQLHRLCKQLAKRVRTTWNPHFIDHPELPAALAQAFPDRIAQRRAAGSSRYVMSNGRGVKLFPADPLARHELLVILDAQGGELEPFVQLAMPIAMTDLQHALSGELTTTPSVHWNRQRQAVEVEQQLRLGALTLNRKAAPRPWPVDATDCLLEQLRHGGLSDIPWPAAANQLRHRVTWLRQQDAVRWPDWSDDALLATLDTWLRPWLADCYSIAALHNLAWHDILLSQLDWATQCALAEQAPTHFRLPAGHDRLIDYQSPAGPLLSDKLQAFLGCREHPRLPNGEPLVVELLSPAGRPLQTTRDLPGFWSGSYHDVAKEMRGRYPKHPWPDDPAHAQATLLTKARLKKQQDIE